MSDTVDSLMQGVANMVTKNRKRLMGFGVLSIILGTIGSFMSVFTTITSVFLIGVFVVIAGLVFFIEAFSAPKWQGKVLNIILSIAYVVVGSAVVIFPAASAIWFTLFLAIFFVILGIVRIVTAISSRDILENWGWMVFSGVLNIILGYIVYSGWPVSGLWVIGLLLSIELIIQGINAIVLSRELKTVQSELIQ